MPRNEEKERLRAEILTSAAETGLKKQDTGRAAEQVRRLPAYRKAKRVFVDLDASLAQVRLNVLLDGKELIAPAPGLKGGYFVLKPFRVAFKDLSFAVTPRGLERHAERLIAGTLAGSPVNLFLTTALALDQSGMRIGDGKGFFDLSCAIIRAYQPRVRPAVFVVGADDMLLGGAIPADRWDVRATGLVTAQGVHMFSETPAALPPVVWEALDEDRIRRTDFLWKLFTRRGGKTREGKPGPLPEHARDFAENEESVMLPPRRPGGGGRRAPRPARERTETFHEKPRQPRKRTWDGQAAEKGREQGGERSFGKPPAGGRKKDFRPRPERADAGRTSGTEGLEARGRPRLRQGKSAAGEQRGVTRHSSGKTGGYGRQKAEGHGEDRGASRGKGRTARSGQEARSRGSRSIPRKNDSQQEARSRKPRKKSGG